MKKKDLFAYLDAIHFVDFGEVEMAVADFFREYVEKTEDYQTGYGDLVYFSELATEYVESKKLNLPIFLPF